VIVLHVNENLERKGGVETYLHALLPLLEERGIGSPWVYDRGDPSAWPTAVAGLGDPREEDAVRDRLAGAIAEIRPDVIHLHSVSNRGAIRACWNHGPTVATVHDYRMVCPANTFYFRRTGGICGRDGAGPGCVPSTLARKCMSIRPSHGPYRYRFARWARERAGRFAAVVAPSAAARERLVRAGFPADRLRVLPYFCPMPIRAEPRPLPERPTITFMGRPGASKGLPEFVAALGLLPASIGGLLVGVGADPTAARAWVRRLAREHQVGDRLEVRPWASRSEAREILDRTTVFVFPSRWPETLGIVGVEALARGVPVIASDVGGVREWLRPGENGHLVAPGDPAQIRDAVLALVDDPAKMAAFGARGIRTVREGFTPETHVEDLVDVYARVVRAHRAGAP
jgi:glycosyltransferase involved in cell wall biosynthesis